MLIDSSWIASTVPRTDVTKTTDRYFTLTRQALEFHKLNPRVIYRVFMRVDVIAINRFVKDYLEVNAHTLGSYKFTPLVEEGEFAAAKTPLFEIEGNFQDLVEHETSILWYVGWPSLSCYNARLIKNIVKNKATLFDMSARHCPGPEAVRMASYAAHIAGFDKCSSQLGADTFNGTAEGSMPHAWIGAFKSTKDAAVAYSKAHPKKPITVLIDYYGKELTDSVECFKALGSRLGAVRIDTHGGRYCEGAIDVEQEGNYAALWRLRDDFGIHQAGIYRDYSVGKGVTVEAVCLLRRALDKAGAKKVKILVSSGFTPEKCESFIQCGAPIDSIGTGSFLPVDMRNTYATADIVQYGFKRKIKVGREWLLDNP